MSRDADDDDRRPRARRRREDEDDYEDDYDDRPRRRRRRDDEDEADATGGIIPYKNPKALTGYYLGFLSLLPVLGVVLGPVAIYLGIRGVQYASAHPRVRGKAHAIIGIVLGVIGFLPCNLIYGPAIFGAIVAATRR